MFVARLAFCKWMNYLLGGGNSNTFGYDFQFWQAYFSDGLVQPPTRLVALGTSSWYIDISDQGKTPLFFASEMVSHEECVFFGTTKRPIWMFPKNMGTPKWMVYNGSNPIKMDDLVVYHHFRIFRKHPYMWPAFKPPVFTGWSRPSVVLPGTKNG